MASYDKLQLIALLRCQISQSLPDTQRLNALETLREAERHSNYCRLLLEVLQDQSLDENTRLVAAISFKNFVARHWKKRARMENDGTPLHDNTDEKKFLRMGVLQLLNENSKTIATQLALLISKIMRSDYPQQWPELQPALVQLLERGSDLQKSRALLALHYVLKEMVTMVLPSQKRAFHEFSSNMLQGCAAMWAYYATELINWLQQWTQQPQATSVHQGEDKANWCVLTTKVMQRLVVDGTHELSQSPAACSFLNHCLQMLIQLHKLYLQAACAQGYSGQEPHPIVEAVARVMKRLLKVIILAQQTHSEAFAEQPSFAPTVQFVLHTLHSLKHPMHRSVLVLPLRLMLEFLQHCLSSRDSSDRYKEVMDGMLSNNDGEQLQCLLSTLVLDYLALTTFEMQDWDASPEEYVYESEEIEGSGADIWTVRHMVHNVLLALLEQYNEPVCQLLIQLLQKVMAQLPNTIDAILQWDCAYQAAGLSCYSLPNYLDFGTGLGPHIVANLQQRDCHRILRRRAAWVLGQWAAVVPQPRTPYYTLLLETVQDSQGSDIVVRLTALKALFWLIDDLQFDPTTFSPLLPTLMEQVFHFLRQSKCVDVRLSLVSLIILLMEKMDTVLMQYTGQLLEVFCGLWSILQACPEADSSETRLKTSLVTALMSLVKCLQGQSQSAHQLVVPMILYTTDLRNKDAIFLLEVGLELWKTTLQYAVDASPALLECFANMPTVVQDSDELAQGLSILDSYVLLGKWPFIQRYATELQGILMKVLSETKDAGQVLCTSTLDTLIHVCPETGPGALHVVFTKVMQYLLTGREGDLVMANYLCVLLHVLLVNRTWFLQFVGDHLAMFLDKWIDLHDSLPSNYQRKLSCLALLSLLPATPDDQAVIPRLGPILRTALEGIAADSGDWIVDYGPHNNDDVPEDSAEAERRQEILEKDVVLHVSVKQVMGIKLQELYAHSARAVAALVLEDPMLMNELTTHLQEGGHGNENS